jgi:TatD DNase family protein
MTGLLYWSNRLPKALKDYFREADQSARELQMEQCRDQLALAIRYDLPVIIHSRECFDDLYALIHQMDCGSRCVIHCFTGTVEQAFAWLEIGAKLSFTGIITYKRNDALREVVRQLPEGSFWLETDGPYLAPEGFRGQRSEPWQVTHCAAMVSDIRGVSLELLSDQTEQAVGSFFRLE